METQTQTQERNYKFGWENKEPKTTEEWRELALSLSESLRTEKIKCQEDNKEYEKQFDEKVNKLCSEVDGFARALSYLLNNSVCGHMTHRERERMAGHALYAVTCMAQEFKNKLNEARYGFLLPF